MLPDHTDPALLNMIATGKRMCASGHWKGSTLFAKRLDIHTDRHRVENKPANDSNDHNISGNDKHSTSSKAVSDNQTSKQDEEHALPPTPAPDSGLRSPGH
jgi:hypothetical protein